VREAFASEGLTISLGIASYPKHGATAEELLTGADRAVFAAKALGRDRTVIFNREIAANLLGEQTRQAVVEEGHLAAVLVLAETLDMRDAGTARHSQLVGRYARSIATEMGMDSEEVERMHLAGVLHDIGKIGIPDVILEKRGPLAVDERRVMQRHPLIGAALLADVPMLEGEGLEVVRSHHERWDGRGYPDGLRGTDIPQGARIFAVADALDAMTTDRPYRPRGTWEQAVEEILRESGGQFDPAVIRAFATRAQRLRRTQLELAKSA
jgi:ribonuclease P protein subunit RPR2